MTKRLSRIGSCFSLVVLSISLHVNAFGATAEPKPVRLLGHLPTNAMYRATYIDRLPSDTSVPVTFVLPLRNQEQLAELIERMYDPNDPQYGKYLTTKEFTEQFAPTKEDHDKVVAYVKSIGLKVDSTHPNRMLISASGTAKKHESVFKIQLHRYLSAENESFYAPDAEPEIPAAIASKISGIIGLSNQGKWKSFHYIQKEEKEHQVLSLATEGPIGGMTPKDIVKAYNLSTVPSKGAGQSIAIFSLGDYNDSDIIAYTNYSGLPPAKVKRVLVGGGNGGVANSEVNLDIQLALAIAPESTIYVYEAPVTYQGILDTYNKIATDNLAKVVSTSWGVEENLTIDPQRKAMNNIFQQFAAQGQTFYAAAGDSGAYPADHQATGSMMLVVNNPSSQPYVTSVGGTSLNVNPATGEYVSETVWNSGLAQGAGGGGVSTIWPIPSWQADVPTVYSKTYRNVPDVSLNADGAHGYAVYFNGQWQIVGGTSCAAPLWAGFTALVNETLTKTGKHTLGFANPVFYKIAKSNSYLTDFHDIAMGDNYYYHAGMGYDNATGLGSFNGGNLYATLTSTTLPPAPPAPTPPIPTPPQPTPPVPTPPVPTPPAPTPVPGTPHYQGTLTHNGFFSRDGIGTYSIMVTNNGTGATTGPTYIACTLPPGLTLNSFSGSGWVGSSNSLIFVQNQVLQPGGSYPPLVLNVNVARNTQSQVITMAIASGGGAPYIVLQDLTNIQ